MSKTKKHGITKNSVRLKFEYKQEIRNRYQLVKVSDNSWMAPPAGLAKWKQLNIVFKSGGAPSASWQSRASAGDRQRHATASGLRRSEPCDNSARKLAL